MISNRPPLDRVTLALIALILIAFLVGAVKVNQQANQISRIIDSQSPLVFAFQNTGTSGRITFVVTCTRTEEETNTESNYVCTTKQTEPSPPTTVTVPTPTPVR